MLCCWVTPNFWENALTAEKKRILILFYTISQIKCLFFTVGSGSGGGTVGSRLAEVDEFKVLILEAGDLPYPENYVPGFFLYNYVTDANWRYRLAPQKHSMYGYKHRVKFLKS